MRLSVIGGVDERLDQIDVANISNFRHVIAYLGSSLGWFGSVGHFFGAFIRKQLVVGRYHVGTAGY